MFIARLGKDRKLFKNAGGFLSKRNNLKINSDDRHLSIERDIQTSNGTKIRRGASD